MGFTIYLQMWKQDESVISQNSWNNCGIWDIANSKYQPNLHDKCLNATKMQLDFEISSSDSACNKLLTPCFDFYVVRFTKWDKTRREISGFQNKREN